MIDQYHLIIRPLPGNWRTHPEGRLKGLLKTLKRGYGFECVSCEPVKEKDKEPNPAPTIVEPEAAKLDPILQCFMCRGLEAKPEWIRLVGTWPLPRFACSKQCETYYAMWSDLT